MPDSYSSQPGVILPIGSSDKDYLLSGLCILGAMSFKLPFLDCHLTLANIIVTNIPSFKAQQYTAMADLGSQEVITPMPVNKGAWSSWGPLHSAAGAGGLHHNM